jgi:ribose 5-phosphate isomerase B
MPWGCAGIPECGPRAPGCRTRPPTGRPRSASIIRVRVYLGSDHAGFELKSRLAAWLSGAGHEPVDCGPPACDADDDYPPYVLRAAHGVISDPGSLGIVIGGSGNGEQIAANKVPGIRAAVAWSAETAELARAHNDANVLSLGARMYPVDDAIGFARVFLETPFSGAARHARRLAQIAGYEKSGQLPPLPDGSPGG